MITWTSQTPAATVALGLLSWPSWLYVAILTFWIWYNCNLWKGGRNKNNPSHWRLLVPKAALLFCSPEVSDILISWNGFIGRSGRGEGNFQIIDTPVMWNTFPGILRHSEKSYQDCVSDQAACCPAAGRESWSHQSSAEPERTRYQPISVLLMKYLLNPSPLVCVCVCVGGGGRGVLPSI